MRCQRTIMSICVWPNMCPMCNCPVTLGGGNSSVNTGRVSPGGGVETEKSFSLIQYSAQRVSIAPGSYVLGRSWAMILKMLSELAFSNQTRRLQLQDASEISKG